MKKIYEFSFWETSICILFYYSVLELFDSIFFQMIPKSSLYSSCYWQGMISRCSLYFQCFLYISLYISPLYFSLSTKVVLTGCVRQSGGWRWRWGGFSGCCRTGNWGGKPIIIPLGTDRYKTKQYWFSIIYTQLISYIKLLHTNIHTKIST